MPSIIPTPNASHNAGARVQRTVQRTTPFFMDLDWGDPAEAETIPGHVSSGRLEEAGSWTEEYWT